MKKTFAWILIIIIVLVVGYVAYEKHFKAAPAANDNTTVAATTTTAANPPADNSAVQYKNTQYGFTFDLPSDWQGYTIVNGIWGTPNSGSSGEVTTGPSISIRNPKWIAANPYQDIPILVLTLQQWNEVVAGKLAVSAAPIPPTELGRNATYVFALPARYNYAYPTGWQEVETIMQSNPLKAF